MIFASLAQSKVGVMALVDRASSCLIFPIAIVVAMIAGCAQPLHIVHDGKFHPAECRNGRWRDAGVVPDIRDHVIAVDGQGRPHDPMMLNGEAMKLKDYRSRLAEIFASMRHFHESHPGRKVLVFVHGGLNSPADSLMAADNEIERIMDAGYYPIFLNWDSDLLDTYREHATSVTQGRTEDGGRVLLTPFYIFADAGRALTRAPVVWSNQLGSDLTAAGADLDALAKHNAESASSNSPDSSKERWANRPEAKAVEQALNNLKDRQRNDEARADPNAPRQEMRIYIGPDFDVNGGHLAGLGISYAITSPTKFGLSWLIDGLGSPAWENMSRRTLVSFDGDFAGNPAEFESTQEKGLPREKRARSAINYTTVGAMEVFREELLRATRFSAGGDDAEGTAGQPYEITLIGHSMGTMVLNEWLRRDILEQRHQFYTNIVYMAAACSVRDFSRAVVPYLLLHGPDPDSKNPGEVLGTQFYSLMLHPLADLRERERGYDIPPRGSLLVWLDDFLTDPQTPLDRTLGRWDNIIPAIDLIPQSVRGQVSLKAFALAPYDDPIPPCGQPDYGPQAHGQFRDRPYWLPEFWYSESPIMQKPNSASIPK